MGDATASPAQLARCHRSLSTAVEPLFAERFPLLALAFYLLIPFQVRPRNRLHYDVHITSVTGPVATATGRAPAVCVSVRYNVVVEMNGDQQGGRKGGSPNAICAVPYGTMHYEKTSGGQ